MMEAFIKVSFLITKFKDMELIVGTKRKFISVNGKITECMVKEKLLGKTDKFMKGNIKMIKNMD
jgi:hypothetical protein